MEKKEISEYEASRLWKVVERLTFDRGDGVRVPVPYDYLDIGCQVRAHIMAQALKEMGYASEKIYIQSWRLDKDEQKERDLHFHTDLASDMPDGRTPRTTWAYHIVSSIQLKTASGTKGRLALDRSLFTRPLTMENWVRKLGKDSYKPISLEDYKTQLTEEYKRDLAKPYQIGTYILITGNNFICIPRSPDELTYWLKGESIPGQNAFEVYRNEVWGHGKKLMITCAEEVPYSRMARSIRQELRNPTIHNAEDADTFLTRLATNFLEDVSEYRCSINSAFSEAFPNLHEDLIEHIKTCAGEASSERFREHFRDHGKKLMITCAERVPYSRMARSIRQELRNPTIYNAEDADTFLTELATNFLEDVSEYRCSTNSAFSEAFPNLYKDLIEYIKTCADEASSERFREHLSGESPAAMGDVQMPQK